MQKFWYEQYDADDLCVCGHRCVLHFGGPGSECPDDITARTYTPGSRFILATPSPIDITATFQFHSYKSVAVGSKPLSNICACGIARVMCDYHK